jgi:hypothetical protein
VDRGNSFHLRTGGERRVEVRVWVSIWVLWEVRLRKGKVGSWSAREVDGKLDKVVRICSAVPTTSFVKLEF